MALIICLIFNKRQQKPNKIKYFKSNVKRKFQLILFLLNAALLFLCFNFSNCQTIKETDEEIKMPPQIRMLRVYGGNDEKLPPVITMENTKSSAEVPVGESFVTIEFDVDAIAPPNLYAKFVHCTADWKEDDNVFLNDFIFSRTSIISWTSSPMLTSYYSYRGKIKVPDEHVKFQFAGNWKMKLYDYYNDTIILAEAKLFVVKPKVSCRLSFISDMYQPSHRVSSISFIIEALASSQQILSENQLNTVVIYRNHRWNEPYYITQNSSLEKNENMYKYKLSTLIAGFGMTGKLFRIAGLPAENTYRVLNLANIAQYPVSNKPVRFPISDLIRNGTFYEYDDDGAMITSTISSFNDNYVYIEFLLDPEGRVSKEDVFVAGSFNNWKPDDKWKMYWDESDRLYHLRQWVRRGRHNYLYATGKYDYGDNKLTNLSYEEFEGNTASSGQTFIAFVYYREFDYGGYDALIGVGAGNIFSLYRR